MVNLVRRIVATLAVALAASTASAVTFNQLGEGVADLTPITVRADLSPVSGTLAQFSLSLNPADNIALGGFADLADGGPTPLLQAAVSSEGGIVSLFSNSATGATGMFVPLSNGNSQIVVTANLNPLSNISMLDLLFAAAPGSANGAYAIPFLLSRSILDAQGVASVVNTQGSFNVTIGPIAPVPLPAGGALMLTGLGAIALMRRKQRKA